MQGLGVLNTDELEYPAVKQKVILEQVALPLEFRAISTLPAQFPLTHSGQFQDTHKTILPPTALNPN